jgi:hypothetical protein
MIVPVYTGYASGGKFHPDNYPAWEKAFYPHDKRRVSVTVARERKVRSTKENNYYHGVCIKMISDSTGQSPESVHDAMRMMFLKVTYDNGMESIRSTTKLSTCEMEEYLTNIRQWASEFLSLFIPLPGEAVNV